MRFFASTMLVTMFMFAAATGTQEQTDIDLLASAAEAAIDAPATQATISDNFGDPDNFIKYIIRKPPVRA